MYSFFVVFGFFFVATASISINYIYRVFSINNVTNFLYPTDGRNVLYEINVTALPTIIWSFIELPVLGNNINFIISVILNIIIACSIMYIFKYGVFLIAKQENNFINNTSIIFASVIGQMVSYMVLKSKVIVDIGGYSYLVSIIGLLLLLLIHCIVIFDMPKLNIKKEVKYEEKRDR